MIDRKNKLLFVHVPKCGGSSVEAVMSQQAMGKPSWGSLSPEERKEMHVGADRQHDTLDCITNTYPIIESFTKFTTIRNPEDRAVSEFFYQKKHQKKLESIRAYAELDLSEAIVSGDLFSNAWKGHDLSSSHLIKSTSGCEVQLFRLEDQIPDLERFLSNHYKKEIKLPHENKASNKKGILPLSDVAKHVLMDKWGADWELGDYKPPHTDRLPRIVWIFWEQGWDSAPRVCKAALKSWKICNPGWDVRALDSSSKEYKESAHLWSGKIMKPCHRADFLRMWLMVKYGGIWADATTLCMKSLSHWVDDAIKPIDFFVFKNHPIANWFIASKPGSEVSRIWLDRSIEYWRDRKQPHKYTWPHHIFGKMISDGVVEGMTHIDASDLLQKGPHMFLPYHADLNGPAGPHFFPRLLRESPPMLKMTWKTNPNPGSKFDWLLRSFE